MADDAKVGFLATEVEGNTPWESTMSLHRVSDEGVGEWILSHEWRSFPADSGTATDLHRRQFQSLGAAGGVRSLTSGKYVW